MLTQAEKVFFERMVPHILAGKSFADAGRAVLGDDERLWLATMERSDTGAEIRRELAAQVYQAVRKGK